MSEKENIKKMMEEFEGGAEPFNWETYHNPPEDDPFIQAIFDKDTAKIAQNMDSPAKKESVNFGTEVDFEDELPEEFPQELAGVDADELADIYTDEIMSYLSSDEYERQVELARRAVAEIQAEKTLPAEEKEYDYLDDIIAILKKPQEDSEK